MERLVISEIDISHSRLVELTKLADQAEPFYDWIEDRFQRYLHRQQPLNGLLQNLDKATLESAILECYAAEREPDLPLLFDGAGRSYTHRKACYYFFSWIIRDAPQQRLGPLIQRIVRNSKRNRIEAEAEVLAALICKYRVQVKTFEWQAVREVILDRLEGSRRAIKGREKEGIVRSALATAIQTFFEENGNYGKYAGVEIADKEIIIGNETFDVSANLLTGNGQCARRILVPIKTRETEGGGHAHLFTRDIKSAMRTVKFANANDFLIAVIVAQNWSEREAISIQQLVDHVVIFKLSPNEFTEFDSEEQIRLNSFMASLLSGEISPKNNES